VRVDGGAVTLGDGVRILRHSTIRVLDELEIGHGGTVNERCEIGGRSVRLGQELWMLAGAKIGGGPRSSTRRGWRPAITCISASTPSSTPRVR